MMRVQQEGIQLSYVKVTYISWIVDIIFLEACIVDKVDIDR